ncbi:hypothetical protein [Streptomyces sp. NBC_01171]|nr:hypothetical protein OG448_00470 [Streptomyces sp. NBC_01171]
MVSLARQVGDALGLLEVVEIEGERRQRGEDPRGWAESAMPSR